MHPVPFRSHCCDCQSCHIDETFHYWVRKVSSQWRQKAKKHSTARDGWNNTVESMRQDLDMEQKAKDTIELSNMDLESNVCSMEANVLSLEAGNMVDAADADSDEQQKHENQRQLNVQLQEQKCWLEHELEQVSVNAKNGDGNRPAWANYNFVWPSLNYSVMSLKLLLSECRSSKKFTVSEKQHPLPDPFSLDWDNLSETELKRLVGQLEKTRSDLRSDLREMEFRLDKEGREFHHHDDFFRMYLAEIKNLDRILASLVHNDIIPVWLHLPWAVLSQVLPPVLTVLQYVPEYAATSGNPLTHSEEIQIFPRNQLDFSLHCIKASLQGFSAPFFSQPCVAHQQHWGADTIREWLCKQNIHLVWLIHQSVL